ENRRREPRRGRRILLGRRLVHAVLGRPGKRSCRRVLRPDGAIRRHAAQRLPASGLWRRVPWTQGRLTHLERAPQHIIEELKGIPIFGLWGVIRRSTFAWRLPMLAGGSTARSPMLCRLFRASGSKR